MNPFNTSIPCLLKANRSGTSLPFFSSCAKYNEGAIGASESQLTRNPRSSFLVALLDCFNETKTNLSKRSTTTRVMHNIPRRCVALLVLVSGCCSNLELKCWSAYSHLTESLFSTVGKGAIRRERRGDAFINGENLPLEQQQYPS